MILIEARHLAEELLARHGLRDWTFRFDRARRRFGSCRSRARTITLSRVLTLLNGPEQVRDTILHEIAHALTPGDGHGERWKEKCREIGAAPKRCYDERCGDDHDDAGAAAGGRVVSPPRRAAPYRIGCPRCGWCLDRRRRTRHKLVCRRCRRPVVLRSHEALDIR